MDKDRFLTISGERKRAKANGEAGPEDKEEMNKARRQQERTFGKFSRK